MVRSKMFERGSKVGSQNKGGQQAFDYQSQLIPRGEHLRREAGGNGFLLNAIGDGIARVPLRCDCVKQDKPVEPDL